MLLIRYKRGESPKPVFSGTEEEVISEILRLDLEDYHDSFFYERGKFENLGLTTLEIFDYYMILDETEFEKIKSLDSSLHFRDN